MQYHCENTGQLWGSMTMASTMTVMYVLRHRNVDKRMSVEASRGEVCVVQRAPVKMGIFEFHQGLEGASAVVVLDMRWVGRCENICLLIGFASR